MVIPPARRKAPCSLALRRLWAFRPPAFPFLAAAGSGLALLTAALLLPRAGADIPAGDSTRGWQAQSFPSVRAIIGVRISDHIAHSGHHSLLIGVKLRGKIPALRQGEAYVDLRFHPPAEVTAPVDLGGHEIGAWVYVPEGLQGPAKNPNGFRLFVKDDHWKSEYGPWTHVRPGHWNHIIFSPAQKAPATGYMDAGFNPGQIVMLGLSVATGKNSPAVYTGDCYLDDVTWGASASPKYDFD